MFASHRPMSVGEIVQSTVSHHLKLLTEVGFVQATPKGTARFYRFNQRCLEAFPTAAELVMGRLPRTEGVQCVPSGHLDELEQEEAVG
jgi:hypothetical protein